MALLGADGNPAVPAVPARPQQTQNDEPPAPTRVTTAFLVYQLPNGSWNVTADAGLPIVPSRPATPDDFISGASNVVAKTTASTAADMAAKLTIGRQIALAQQAQEAQQNAQVQALLANGVKR